ncbi:substrate-binding domain-containing protein [Facklamia hominis]|uniref:substrate-binding domain-containing protein n=1 Tax=Facklamia hominis TaxID=178214 RepID=UPI00288BE40D|nr:substrate-binding domain-containing protein [Facklamia hominis]WPJ91098.1 substrate-binding domain-containing protein [Facklamia hominis]
MKKSLKVLPMLAAVGLGLSAVVPAFAQEGPINVITREDGSGTRGAFVEIVGVTDEDGNDLTSPEAVTQNQTSGVLTTVAGDPSAIGYISLGSLNDTVKALKVDDVEATPENVANGKYPIARPFNVAWSNENDLSEVAKDFLAFIQSKEGQTIAEEEGFIAVTDMMADSNEAKEDSESSEETEEANEETQDEASTEEESAESEAESEESSEETAEEGGLHGAASLPSYEPAGELEGTIECIGSTSVSPLMEKLAEAYKELQPKVEINITANGSSAGMEAAINGTADLGMASRELKDEEKEVLSSTEIALDGIAVVVNNDNPAEGLSLEAIRSIFLGELSQWEEAVK